MIDIKYLLSAQSIWHYVSHYGWHNFTLGPDILIFGFQNFSRLNVVYCIQQCLNGVEYSIYIGNVFSFTLIISFLLSFLGILSVWSDSLQEERNCTKDKNIHKIINENSN